MAMGVKPQTGPKMRGADRITLEVIRHQLVGIPNQIERNVERTAFSPLIYEYKDYAVGIVDAEGGLVAQSKGSLPIFVANALGTAVREGLSVLGQDAIEDNDVIITNTAACLGQHLNNVVAYTPIRHSNDLIGFFCVLFHWVDIGGAVPGSCLSTSTRDVWQEGIQFPTIKLIEKGKRRNDVFRMIATNTRFPKLLIGDVEAQIGACMAGRKEVHGLLERYGPEDVRSAIAMMWRNSENAVAGILEAAPEREYTAETELDDDGVNLGQRVPVKVMVRVSGGRLVVDLSGLAEQVAGPFNAGRNGGAIAAARIAFKYLFAPSTPVNQGDFARLDVVIPDGRFLSASADAPIGHSGSTVPTVVDTILNAMGQAFPKRAAAAHHGIYGIHAFYGQLPETGERYQNLDTVTGGWGASAGMDGAGPFRSNGHGDVPDVPVEMQEAFYPYRIVAKRLIANSGGAGRWRGGLGVEKLYQIDAPCTFMAAFDRVHNPPVGLADGGLAKSGGVQILRVGGESEFFTKGERFLFPGDRIVVSSGGGGGFGPALERAPKDVATDVRQGYVTRDAAVLDYGVVIGVDGEIDEKESRRIRQDMEARGNQRSPYWEGNQAPAGLEEPLGAEEGKL